MPLNPWWSGILSPARQKLKLRNIGLFSDLLVRSSEIIVIDWSVILFNNVWLRMPGAGAILIQRW